MSQQKKKKVNKRDLLDMGRLLGVIAREDPELYQAIKQYAEVNEQPAHQTVINILKQYFLIQRVKMANLDMEQLFTAWEILKELIKYSMWMYTSLGTMFFSEMTRAYGEVIDQKVKAHLENIQQSQPVDEELRRRLLGTLLDIMEPMLKSTLKAVFKAQGQPIPESLKVKVPVNLTIEEKS